MPRYIGQRDSDFRLVAFTDASKQMFGTVSGAPRGVSWLPGNPPKSVKYCIVINFEKRGRESYSWRAGGCLFAFREGIFHGYF